jgi:sugar phosphate isomerase/epimerase
VAGGHGSPLPFLDRNADRVTHVHLHDRRTRDGAQTWFGQGDAPIRDVLIAMRDGQWPSQAVIEIGYDLATEADQMKEIARAIAYCRTCVQDAGSRRK